MTAGKYRIDIEQGATFPLDIVYKDEDGLPVNLTGYIARMQIRESHESALSIISLDSDLLGGIVIDAPNGAITVTIPASVTAGFPAPIVGVYDLEIEDSLGFVTRLLEGKARIKPEVTR